MIMPPPIITIQAACGTPVHPLSKLSQKNIEHLTSETELPLRNKSTKAVLKRILFVNENFTPLNEEAIFVFPDINKMYPNVDKREGLQNIKEKHDANPNEFGLPTNCIVEALAICNDCNCIQFNGKFYLPCKGCAMGPAHGCDFTDIWVGQVMEKHVNTCPVETVHFSIYRDDGLYILKNGARDLKQFEDHLNNLHPNLTFETRSGKEGPYLDLWIMIKDGKIETRNFKKFEPTYLDPKSCHDNSVFRGLYKGVGLRLRLNCSEDKDFDTAVEQYSKAFAWSGHNF